MAFPVPGYKPVKLAYDKLEPDDGPNPSLSPVLFLHELCHSRESWKDVPKETANATKRVAYNIDARNHGESEWSEDFSIEMNAQDVLHFMDSHGIRKAVLVGIGVGGITASMIATQEPGRVEKIVLEDTTLEKITAERMQMSAASVSLFRKIAEELDPALIETEAKKSISDSMMKSFVGATTCCPAKVQPRDFEGMLNIKKGENGRWTIRTNVEAIANAGKSGKMITSEIKSSYQGPACVIYAPASAVNVFKCLDDIRRIFPKAEITAVEDAGHVVHNDQPKEFMDIFLKFLL